MNAVSTKVLQPERSIGCMTYLFPTKPYYLLGEREENIKQAKGNVCSQYKSTAA
jgi:hypothetical protein